MADKKDHKKEKDKKIKENLEDRNEETLLDDKVLPRIAITLSIIALGLSIYNAIQIQSLPQKISSMALIGNLEEIKLPLVDSYDPTYNSSNSKAIIFEYTDYQCPFCRRHTLETFPQIYDNYIKTGIITYVYKDFALPFHSHSKEMARFADCIYRIYGLQDYSEFKMWAFENQDKWTTENFTSVVDDELKSLGLEVSKVEQCTNSTEIQKDIEGDLKEVEEYSQYGMTGTPSFLIALKSSEVTDQELLSIKRTLDSLQRMGLTYTLGKTPDGEYYVIIFAGAIPYQYFDKILSVVKQ